MAKAYIIDYVRERAEGDDYLVGHDVSLYLMNPDGKYVKDLDSTLPGEQIADQLRRLMGRAAS